MKIYLAGKIRKENDWRLSIIQNKRLLDAQDPLDSEAWFAAANAIIEGRQADIVWPILRKTIFEKHDYVGPYFIACDHSCGHGISQHGVAASHASDCFGSLGRERTADLCRSAIKSADLVFAWIESPDAYGTIAELGYAHGLKKKIFIAGPAHFDDHWFVYNFCHSGAEANFSFATANEALKWHLGLSRQKPKQTQKKEMKQVDIFLSTMALFENEKQIGAGGWASILSFDDNEIILRGGKSDTSKSEMSLQAAITSLSRLEESYQVRLYSDSHYLVKGITEWITQWQKNGWRIRTGEQVKYVDLWKILIEAVAPHDIEWNLVKQSDGNEVLESCHEIAYAVADYYNGADYLCERCGESGGTPNEQCLLCRHYAGNKT